ncbi:hypothetical protein DV735_g2380, partial [Chaetothyriales sp. CBS 134920]
MARLSLFHFFSFLSLAWLLSAAPVSLEQRATEPVRFVICLTWGDFNPIGAAEPRKAILVNGSIPGPPLNVTQGDDVEFLVHNGLPNATAVHFHGIEQKNTPWSDGVPGLSQHAIQPGEWFLYKWTATTSGTYFYHAHYQGQITDGLYGAIHVQPAAPADRPWAYISNDSSVQSALTAADQSQQVLFLSDYSKYPSNEFLQIQKDANIDNTCADAILINGKGSQYCLSRGEISAYTSPRVQPLLASVDPPQLTDKGCLPPNLRATQGDFVVNLDAIPADAYYECVPSSGEIATITVDPSQKWAALTLINTGDFSLLKFAIDAHQLWVYALDGHYIEPQLVDTLTVNHGDRISVLIELNQPSAQYSIRVPNAGLNQVISGFGVLSYKDSTGPASSDPNALSKLNYAGANTSAVVTFNPSIAAPFPPVQVGQTADATFNFNIKKLGQPHGAWEWTLTGTEAYNLTRDDAEPLLFQEPTDIPNSELVIRTTIGQWVDLIINVAGPLAQPHPLHKHSNKAFVLGQGIGTFGYSTVGEAAAALPAGTFNFVNPPFRDGYTTTPAEGNSSWIALRYHVENPGAFLFHCHIQTHLSGGMGFVILDGVDEWPEVPDEYLTGSGLVALKKMGKTRTV